MSRRMAGVATKVLTIAMITSMVKVRFGKTPMSYPTFSTTSSSSPRVFMHTPSVVDVLWSSPSARAAT